MAEGTIKKLIDKGFGFIKTAGPKDIYFHSSALQGASFEELKVGQKVSYTEGQSPKGPCAENVTPV
jgi:CspA family cold shock protein